MLITMHSNYPMSPINARNLPLTPGLYIIATPIGNLEDITLRALRVLEAADVVACEDTRVTQTLLTHYGIKAKMLPYHDFSEPHVVRTITARIAEGKVVALVSDAGTPLISDPGYTLVQEVVRQGLPLTTLPGPSSVMAALTLAGLPTNAFLFGGFLPPKTAARSKTLAEWQRVKASLVFLESPRRLGETLTDMAATLGNRQAAVVREATKKFEEVRRGSLSELAEYYTAEEPRGEIVIVVAPPAEEMVDADTLDAAIRESLKTMSVKEVAVSLAEIYGVPKKQVYQRALELSRI